MLPYYRLNKTQEDKKFFYENTGYFNFWDKILILRDKKCVNDNIVGVVLINRTDYKFKSKLSSNPHKDVYESHIAESLSLRKPEDMFTDFPELLQF